MLRFVTSDCHKRLFFILKFCSLHLQIPPILAKHVCARAWGPLDRREFQLQKDSCMFSARRGIRTRNLKISSRSYSDLTPEYLLRVSRATDCASPALGMARLCTPIVVGSPPTLYAPNHSLAALHDLGTKYNIII
jgi:hypothetical protein